MATTVWTVGHSTRSIDEFIAILDSFAIKVLADVRHYPGSKRYPHFGKENLQRALANAGIEYIHMPGLGGRRSPAAYSRQNSGWKNPQFRGYADYMQSENFVHALAQFASIAEEHPTAMMCAEAVPWRCHRSLVSDALMARSFRVIDIFEVGKATEHKLTSFARIEGNRVTYPSAGGEQLTLI